jgi:hypothetical protein
MKNSEDLFPMKELQLVIDLVKTFIEENKKTLVRSYHNTTDYQRFGFLLTTLVLLFLFLHNKIKIESELSI